MDREQFREYLKYLYEANIRARLGHARFFKHFHFREEFDYKWRRLSEVSQILRFINKTAVHDDDPYRVFNQQRLDQLTDDVRQTADFTHHIARDSGFLDVMDEHLDEILAGMELEDFPAEETEILRHLGSEVPDGELVAIIMKVKSGIPQRKRQNECLVSEGLANVSSRLGHLEEQFKRHADTEKPLKKPRKWFKGLGKVISGVGVTVGDIGLAAGLIPLPVLGQIPTTGALVSAAAGIGTILDGIGELRGE